MRRIEALGELTQDPRIPEWWVSTPALVCRRHRRDKDVYVQVLYECEWEPEHGLQLVFRRGAILVRVSEQDGHLTRADAYDVPDEEDEWLRRS